MAEIQFSTRLLKHPESQAEGDNSPFKLVVVGAFSGHAKDTPLAKRKLRRITKDTFDEVFNSLEVELTLTALGSQVSFEDIDDLTPEHLYRNIGIFQEYKALKKALLKPGAIDSTIAKLNALGIGFETKDSEAKEGYQLDDAPVTFASDLFDTLLSQPTEQTRTGFDVDALIRDTVAPFVQKHDPRAQDYLAALERAESQLLRAILQQSQFQTLEASWLALERFNRTVDTDRSCHLYMLDVDSDELLSLADEDIETSAIFTKLISDQQIAGNPPFDAILLDSGIKQTESLNTLLNTWQSFSQKSQTPVITGVNYAFAQTLVDEACPLDLQASKLSVVAPSFMMRVPYGSQTRPCEMFDFEEVELTKTDQPNLKHYVWGNSGYLWLMEQLAGSNTLSGLPYASYTDSDGDTQVIPPTGMYLSQTEIAPLRERGIIVAESVKNSDRVIFN